MKTLRPYQRAACSFVWNERWGYGETGGGVLLDFDPGTGKTAVVVTLAAHLIKTGKAKRVLVVCGLLRIVKQVWPAAIAEWAPHLSHQVLWREGPKSKIRDNGAQISITNYQTWKLTEGHGGACDTDKYDMLVFDESAVMKNSDTAITRSMLLVRKFYRYIIEMSGMPAPNGEMDYWAQLVVCGLDAPSFIAWRARWFKSSSRVVTHWKVKQGQLPGVFQKSHWVPTFRVTEVHRRLGTDAGPLWRWRDEHFDEAHVKDKDWKLKPGIRDEFYRRCVTPFVFTVRKGDELPPMIIIPVEVEMEAKERAAYSRMAREAFLEFDDGKAVAKNPMTLVQKLLELASGFIYRKGADDKRVVERVGNAKRDAVLELVLGKLAGRPVVIVVNFKEEAHALLPALRKKGKAEFVTDIAKEDDKQRVIQQFIDGELDWLLIHPKSCGHGIDGLQHRCAQMVWAGPTHSPEFWEQTRQRLERLGQTEAMTVYVVLAEGTHDKRVFESTLGQVDSSDMGRDIVAEFRREWAATRNQKERAA